ncbi:hypothetical protein TMatcc_005432 [Talaromyces marneffei ATCC 18224]|uniref:Rhodopsin domain-containing protein n=2 Tax=Talaromyces marneffei TaxID=37727 RepID=B6QAK6_TALMQ|nr:uncharacterized protein EYB26_006022 [Talaromyces marneffei]EEA26302.1 conserved hypothetical protein [Talaromyces marneffei ATCC 18224]KAE8555000.1 hypothetical protein EYB25_003547 [Talaromyces marneffei]QGA18338.1 hypothetical protein EYB26_006022 [Talaromyces marneffei]
MSSRAFSEGFQNETWALYAVGVFGTALRFVARIRRLGLRNIQVDDYLMVLGVIWYTILCVALNQVASGGGSNLMTDEDIANLTPSIYAERVRGSKWVFVSEHAFILTVWSCKSCMLVIYARLTDGLAQKRLIYYCSAYVAVGFVAVELCLFLSCIPLQNYWAVPTPNPQCSTYQHYEIVQACFSITADIFMLLVAIPLLVKIQLPLRQKLILVLLFGMGVFVIVAAILTKVYCLVPSLISYVYMNWYFREATVAMLVTNLPLIWSLLRDIFPNLLNSWTGGSKKGADRYYPSMPFSSTTRSKGTRTYGMNSQVQSTPHFNMNEFAIKSQKNASGLDITRADSNSTDLNSDDGSDRALRIRQDITVTIEAEERQEPAREAMSQPHGWEVKGSDAQTS